MGISKWWTYNRNNHYFFADFKQVSNLVYFIRIPSNFRSIRVNTSIVSLCYFIKTRQYYCRIFKLGKANRQRKNRVKSIGATPAARLSPAWTASRLINVLTLERNRTNVPAVTKRSHRNHISIVISRHTKNALQNTPLSVQRAAKRFTTSHPITLIFAPRINKKPPPVVNDQPLKHQMLRQRNCRKRLLRLARVLFHKPFLKRQPLLLLLLVPAGKKILSSSRPTLFQALTKIFLRFSDSTGHRFVHVSVEGTDFKTSTISAWPPSVQPAFASS